MTHNIYTYLSYTSTMEMQCECDRHIHCFTDECDIPTYCKFHVTSESEDNSYWLCLECLVHHFQGDPAWITMDSDSVDMEYVHPASRH